MIPMWLVLSLAAALIFTALNLLTRILAVKSDHPRAFSFVYNSWGVLFAALAYVVINHVVFFVTNSK